MGLWNAKIDRGNPSEGVELEQVFTLNVEVPQIHFWKSNAT